MAVGDAHAFHGFFTPVLTQISFQSNQLLFPHASAEVRGKTIPERNFASTRSRTRNDQVMSPTGSLLSHQGRAGALSRKVAVYMAANFKTGYKR